MQEEWRDIKDYEGLYQVSNLGNVKRIATYKYSRKMKKSILTHIEKYLNLGITKRGYLSVTLCNNTIRKKFPVHRLVAQAFIPNPDNKPQINHKDCNKCNNTVNNLEWCTCKENMEHASQHKLLHGGNYKKYSALNSSSKKVVQYDKYGKYIKTWDCISDVTRVLGISASTISACCKHKKYNHTAGGFKWEYI